MAMQRSRAVRGRLARAGRWLIGEGVKWTVRTLVGAVVAGVGATAVIVGYAAWLDVAVAARRDVPMTLFQGAVIGLAESPWLWVLVPLAALLLTLLGLVGLAYWQTRKPKDYLKWRPVTGEFPHAAKVAITNTGRTRDALHKTQCRFLKIATLMAGEWWEGESETFLEWAASEIREDGSVGGISFDVPNDGLEHYVDVVAMTEDPKSWHLRAFDDRTAFRRGSSWYRLDLAITSPDLPASVPVSLLLDFHYRPGIPAPLILRKWEPHGPNLIAQQKREATARRPAPAETQG